MAPDQYGAGEPALCQHRGPGRGATREMCRLGTASQQNQLCYMARFVVLKRADERLAAPLEELQLA